MPARHAIPCRRLVPVVPPEIECHITSRCDDMRQSGESRLEIEKLHRCGSERGDRMEIVCCGAVETHGKELRRAPEEMPTRDIQHRLGWLNQNGLAVVVASEKK